MERSNLGKGLRLYFLGQVFALISIEGMTLALIPLMAAVMNSTFQLERQWTVYMPYGAKEMEAMTLSPDVLVPYALLTLLLGIVMLVCDIVSLVALVKLRREHPLYRRALFLTLVAAGIQILTALLQWEGIFVSAAWLAIACAATVFFLQGTNDILIQRTGELEARYNTLALRGRVVPWIYVICTVLTWLLAWGVESYTMAAPAVTWQTGFMWAYVILGIILGVAAALPCLIYLWKASRALTDLYPGRNGMRPIPWEG